MSLGDIPEVNVVPILIRMDELEAWSEKHECPECQSHERCSSYMFVQAELTDLLLSLPPGYDPDSRR